MPWRQDTILGAYVFHNHLLFFSATMANITTFVMPSDPVTDSPNLENKTVTASLTTLSYTTTSENYNTADRDTTVTVTRTAFPTTSNTSEVTYTKENGMFVLNSFGIYNLGT